MKSRLALIKSKLAATRQTFRSFENPVYRIYFCGMLGQMASMNMQMIARSLLIYRLSDSATILGAMSFANAIPMLTLSLFGGVIADRVQKKYVMITGQIVSGVVALAVAVTLTTDILNDTNPASWWILVGASIMQGVVMALMMPSRQSYLPEIVSGEDLMNAIALNSMGMNVLRLVAPALAGFLIEWFDFEAVYYTTGTLYLLSSVFIFFLPRTTRASRGQGNAWSEVKAGLSYIKGETSIMLILGFTLVMVLLSMPLNMMMPVFTETILNVGSGGLGVLMSVSGAGAMAGSLVLASLPNKKRGLMMLVSGVILGLALTAFAFSTSYALSIGIIVFVGIGQQGQMTLGNTLINYYVENEYRGRVMSIMMMQFGLTSMGAFLAGVLVDSLGANWSIGGFAMLLVVLSVLALMFLPKIRNLD